MPYRKSTSPTGANAHKEGCQCRICGARRRKAEALALAARVGGDALARVESAVSQYDRVKQDQDIINASLPTIEVKGNKARDRVVEWLAIKSVEPQLKNSQIAQKMGIAPGTLQSYIYRATKAGWLKFDDPLERLEHELMPAVVDNLAEFLKNKDKSVTLETAKATIYKQYLESKGVNENPTTVLALKIETVGIDDPKIIAGHVVGKPRQLSEVN